MKLGRRVMRKQRNSSKQNENVDDLVDEFSNLCETDRAQFLSMMRSEYAKRGGEHYCGTLDCNVVAPCNLSSCCFNYKSEGNLNCLLRLKASFGESLKLQELHGIFGDTDRELKGRVESIFNKFRREMLRKTLESEKVNTFKYIFGTKVCVNCGNLCTGHVHKLERHDLRWCSRVCKSAKPQWCVNMEVTYGTDMKTLLYHAYKQFKKLQIIASLFKVRKTTLIDAYYEYFGIKPSKFGFEAVDNVDLLRNPNASKTTEMLWHDVNKENRFCKLERECDKLVKTL